MLNGKAQAQMQEGLPDLWFQIHGFKQPQVKNAFFFNSRTFHKAKLEFGVPVTVHIAHLHGTYNYLPLIYIAFGIIGNLDI